MILTTSSEESDDPNDTLTASTYHSSPSASYASIIGRKSCIKSSATTSNPVNIITNKLPKTPRTAPIRNPANYNNVNVTPSKSHSSPSPHRTPPKPTKPAMRSPAIYIIKI